MRTKAEERAIRFATIAHEGQTRKWSDLPYITHPIAVSEAVKAHDLSEDAVIAAILHDTVEDTDVTMEDIQRIFGDNVAEYVWYLTKPPAYVGNRKVRKAHDCARLKLAPDEVKIIKLFDIRHNASCGMKENDPEFWDTWRSESNILLWEMDLPNEFKPAFL